MKSPSKSCLLDPWPTFLVKECINILLPYWFDLDFSFSCHVMKVCNGCFAHVQDLN